MPNEANEVLFQTLTPIGFSVRVTAERWKLIVTAKHPVMAGRESLVRAALETPDEVRQSRTDPQVLLFYRRRPPSGGRAQLPSAWGTVGF